MEEQLAMLEDEEECGHTWDAYQHLVADPESSYGRFVAMHKQFLQRNRAAIEVDERRLQLPRRALEEEGLECAVWPHLYPKTAWCETHVRLQDVRRKESRQGRARSRRRNKPAAAAAGTANKSSSSSSASSDSDSSNSSSSEEMSVAAARPQAEEAEAEPAAEETEAESEDEDEEAAPLHFAREGRNSAKSSYLAKVLGPTLGYGSTYELLNFPVRLRSLVVVVFGCQEEHGRGTDEAGNGRVQLLTRVLAEPACWTRGLGQTAGVANTLPDHCSL